MAEHATIVRTAGEPPATVAVAPPRPTTAAQHERYTRMLDATLAILDEAGVAGLQVREVALRADVALGTLYRYFPSKDLLLARALTHWSRGLADRLGPPASAAPRARARPDAPRALSRALRSIARSFAAHPHYAAAAVLVASSADPFVPEALAEYQASFAAGLDAVLRDLPEAHRDDVRFVIESVLIAQLVGFSSQRRSPAEMEAALERAVRVLALEPTTTPPAAPPTTDPPTTDPPTPDPKAHP